MARLVTTTTTETRDDAVVTRTETRRVRSPLTRALIALGVALCFLIPTAALLSVVALGWVSVSAIAHGSHPGTALLVAVPVAALTITVVFVLWTQLWCHAFERDTTTTKGTAVSSSTKVTSAVKEG